MTSKGSQNTDLEKVKRSTLSEAELSKLEKILVEDYGLKRVDNIEKQKTNVDQQKDTDLNSDSKDYIVEKDQDTMTVILNGKELKLRIARTKPQREKTSKNDKEGAKLPKEILDAYSPNIIKEIGLNYIENKNKILVLNDIVPLMNNLEFVDLMVDNGIYFTSTKNSKIARAFSTTLNHLSNRLNEKVGGNRDAGKRIKEEAIDFAKKLGPKLEELEENGFLSFGAKARYLNTNEIKTLRGKEWTRTTVKMVWERWQKLRAEEEENKSSNISTKPPKP